MKLIETIQIVKAAGEQSLLLCKKGKVYTNVAPVDDAVNDFYKVSFRVYYEMLTVDTIDTTVASEAVEILNQIKQIVNEGDKYMEAEDEQD